MVSTAAGYGCRAVPVPLRRQATLRYVVSIGEFASAERRHSGR